MLRILVRRAGPPAWSTLVLALLLPSPLLSQSPDSSSASSRHVITGDWIRLLPLDRSADALTLEPGVTTTLDGELLLRGGGPGDAAIYLDGVPVLSGFRSRPFFGLSRFQSLESSPSYSPATVDSVTVITGPLDADLGNGESGAILFHSRDAAPGLRAGVSYETDELFGTAHSFGTNRVLGSVEGMLRPGLSFFVAGMLEGQRSVATGFESEDAPIFVAAGIDTTVAVPSTFGDPSADTTLVPIDNLAISRGSCDAIAGSANAEIANNYGFDCRGSRTPQSPVSGYEFMGKLSYAVGAGARVSLLALLDQHQNRNFDYGTLSNSAGITGNRTTSSLFIVGWHLPLARGSQRPLRLDANLSFQSDREHSGPLSQEGVTSTADPFGGYLISPIDLRFDFDNFPVDDELIRNYRTNEPGSRRTPYDLENPAQYAEVDRWRNDAYGLYNRDPIAQLVFPEQGGPVGLLTLYRENRTVGSASVSWQPAASHRVLVGGEFTRYSISNYSSLLTTLSFSDMYLEHPIRGALFAEDRIQLAGATLVGGLRYDFYDSRARRPADFPRISSNPQYNTANPDAFFHSDRLFPRDDRHGYLSPHIQAAIPVAPRTVFRGGFAVQAQVPDFRAILLGINTDLSVTDVGTVFGTDLEFERTKHFELGVRHSVNGHLSLDLAFYNRNLEGGVEVRQVSRFDPLRSNNVDLRLLLNDRKERVRGVELKLEERGSFVAGWVGYAYQDATVSPEPSSFTSGDRLSTPNSRPHSITGALAVALPSEWKPGSLGGAILRNAELGMVVRLASGTPYTSCSAGVLANETVLSPDLCGSGFGKLNDSRLPWFKQLDVRLAKRFGPGSRFAGYVDARNLLNFRNVLAVFATNGGTSNPVERHANWTADSADYASEAEVNSAYRSDGSIDLGQGQVNPVPACRTWADQTGSPAVPNCVYLIRAEERFGNGDHLFDLAEQRRASEALYQVVRGPQELTGPPRRIRLGLEASF